MPAQPHQPSQRLSLGLLVLLTALAALLRLPHLSADSLWFDEAATWSQVNSSFVAMLSDTISDNYPPLYNFVTWLLVQVLGQSEWVLRLPAALFGIATIPMVYLLGSRVGGRWTGLLAALLITLSGFHVWYSVEARMYSLLALAACAYAWVALREMDGETRSGGWALIGIAVALLLSHPYGALCWFAISAPIFCFSARRKRLLRLYAISLAIFLPFGLSLLVHAYEIVLDGFWIPEPYPAFVLQQFNDLTSGLFIGLLVCASAAFVPKPGTSRSPALLVLLSLALVPGLIGFIASWITEPVFLSRYLIGSLPAIVVLAAAGVTRWLTDRRALLAASAVAAVAGGLSLVYASPPARQDWRSAAAHIGQTFGPGDCIMTLPRYNRRVWSYYLPGACLITTLEDALDKVPGRLFVAVEPESTDTAPFLDYTPRPLLSTTQVHRITIFEFGPAQ